jgi:integrase
MVRLGIKLAFNFGLRISEYAHETRNNYSFKCKDIYFIHRDGVRSTPIEIRKNNRPVESVKIVIWDSKAGRGVPRDLFITRGNAGESGLIDDLIAWSKEAGFSLEDPFLSRVFCSRRKVLTSQMVSIAIKETAREMGLNPEAFSTHSLRSGAMTTMKASGKDTAMVRRITGIAAESNIETVYTRNIPTDGGTLSVVSGGNRIPNAGDLRLMSGGSNFKKRKRIIQR